MGRKWIAIGSGLIAMGVGVSLLPSAPQSKAADYPASAQTTKHVHERSSAALETSMSRQAGRSRNTGGEDKSRVLVTNKRGTVSVVNPVTQRILYRAREGVVSPTENRVYGDVGGAVEIVTTRTGHKVGRVHSPAGKALHIVSTSGSQLAFARPEEHGASEWLPLGRSRTKITIAKTTTRRKRTYDLKGNFGMEAFSTNERELFLIKYMPAMNPWHYGVRRLDLATGTVHKIARSKQNAPGEMNGTGRLSRFSPDGTELYTLYTQQGPNYTHVHPEDADKRETYAFIHQLNLGGARTHCIDLPPPFGTGTATSHAMAVSDDGTRIYVADPSSGGLVVVDAGRSLVLRSATLDLRFMRKKASATVSPDGTLYLAGRNEIKAFDGETLRHLRTFPAPRRASWISASDSELYVGTAKNFLVLDKWTGRRLNG